MGRSAGRPLRVGLISDTHGLVRPEALAFLRGADAIVHGGDIGTPAVLSSLAALAPLTAVRGNNDAGPWAARLPESAQLHAGAVLVHVLHIVAELARLRPPPGARVVVSGHSHRPHITEADGRLHVNPGSAGPRRFGLPVAAGELIVRGSRLRVRIVDLLTGAQLAEY